MSASTERASVWVIKQWEYSNYRVVGVFSSKENAELVLAAMDNPKASIAKWPLDPAVKKLRSGWQLWDGRMLRDGTVEHMERFPLPRYGFGLVASKLEIWRRSTALAFRGEDKPDCLFGTVWATDREHAVKIFNEQRTKLIALGKW